MVLAGWVELTAEEQGELRALINSADVPATVATRARIVSWHAEKRRKTEISQLAGLSRPTVDLWLGRYGAGGVAGLLDHSHAAPREQVPARIRARVLSLTRASPPVETGLSHWSSREMAAYIQRTEGALHGPVTHRPHADARRDPTGEGKGTPGLSDLTAATDVGPQT